MPRRLMMIWETLAAAGVDPRRAVLLMAAQGERYTASEAAMQLADANGRNTLRLVKFD